VTDKDGRRHSLDVPAKSTFDAAHLYVVHAKTNGAGRFPVPTPATVFEVVTDGRLYRVSGVDLQAWILKRRAELNGPKGYLFSQRPTL
jgi:hypothetical protein